MGCNSSRQQPVMVPEHRSRVVGLEINRHDNQVFGAVGPNIPHRPITTESIGNPNTFTYGSMITLEKLLSIRKLFWETQVGGNAIVWTTLKAAANAILDGENDLANALLEASLITAPHGTLEECFDEFGYRYLVPRFCFSNPKEMMNAASESKSSEANAECDSPKTVSTDATGDEMKVRVRVAPGENDFKIEISASASILELKRLVGARIVASGNARFADVVATSLRIIYMGKEVPDNATITQAGMNTTTVVHAYIRPNRK